MTNPTTGVEVTRNIPECATRSAPDAPYDLDLNVMYKFASLPAVGNSVVAQSIPFQAVTLPGADATIRSLMQSGGQWNNILTGRVNWEITAQRKTRQARYHINWEQVFEQASTFAAFHANACIDIELKEFFQKLTQCKKEDECGIRVEYLQADGAWGDKAPDDASFVNASNEVQKRVQNELFTAVSNRSQSQLGRVSDMATSAFTLRANYEKILFSRNEVVPFCRLPFRTLRAGGNMRSLPRCASRGEASLRRNGRESSAVRRLGRRRGPLAPTENPPSRSGRRRNGAAARYAHEWDRNCELIRRSA